MYWHWQIFYSIVTIIALLAAGTFFSGAEMAFAALNRARVKNMAENGDKKAKRVLKLYENFESLISTLLICNNGVALATATVSTLLFLQLMGDAGPLVSTIIITIIVVVFTDDLPKSIAKQDPEKYAFICAPILSFLVFIFRPINFLNVRWKTRINARFAAKKEKGEELGFRGEELLYVVEEAEQEGTITEEDSLRISNAIEFNDLLAEDILTPRVGIVGISLESSFEHISGVFTESEYSRLPVYKDNLDNIVGILHIKDYLKHATSLKKPLKDIMTPAIYTASITQIPELLKSLQKEKQHMVVVVDEHGGTEGIVTMDDILKKLVGDIYDEHDEQDESFTSLGQGKHKVKCSADIYKMFEYFDLEDEEADSNTVGGWITDTLERLPQKGDSFTYKNLAVTVTSADLKMAQECIIEVMPN